MTNGENTSLFQDFNYVHDNSDIRNWIIHNQKLFVAFGESHSSSMMYEVDLVLQKLICTGNCSKVVGNNPFIFNGEIYYFSSYGGLLFKYDEDGGPYTAMREIKKAKNLHITNVFNLDDDKLFILGKNSIGYLNNEEDTIYVIKEFHVGIYDDIEMGSVGKVGNKLLFTVRIDYNGWQEDTDELWLSDGTPEGTEMLKSFNWNRHQSGSAMMDFVEMGGKIYFAGNANQHGLWVTDGTVEGTRIQKSLEVWKGSYYNPRMTKYGNKLYFQTSSNYLAIYEPALDQLFILQNDLQELQFKGGTGGIFFFTSKKDFKTLLWMDKPQPLASFSDPLGGSVVFKTVQKDSCSWIVFQIKNVGREPLFFSEIFLTGSPFFLEKSFPESINPGASHSFKVFFFPADSGYFKGSLIINTNDRTNPTIRVGLEGSATEKDKNLDYACYDLVLSNKLFAPSNHKKVSISNDKVSENNQIGIVVGELFVEGNSNQTFSFSLSTGVGDRDNSFFSINGNQLFLNKTVDYEIDHLLTLKITATNSLESHTNHLLIKVLDVNEWGIEASCGYRTEDLGSPIADAAYVNNSSIIAVGAYNLIIKSDDGGKTWYSISPDLKDSYFRVLFPSQDTGYVCSDYTLLKTLNEGQLWQALYVPLDDDEMIADISFVTGNSGYLLTSRGRLFKTLNGGLHWLFINKIEYDTWNFPTYNRHFHCMTFYDNQHGYIGSSKGIIYKTTNGGLRWDETSTNGMQVADVKSIQLMDKDDVYIRLVNDKIYKSTNGGQNWMPMATEFSDITAVQMVNSMEGYLFTIYSGIYKTNNGGSSWVLAYQQWGKVNKFAVSKDNVGITAVGQSGIWNYGSFGHKLIITGRSNQWETISELEPDDSMAIEWIDEKNGVSRITRYDNYASFYKTSDGGLTWKKILDKPIKLFESMTLPTPNTIIIQAHDSEYNPVTYKTTDGGKTWTSLNNNLQLKCIYLYDEMNGYAGRFYQYGTEVKEFYKTSDGGSTWFHVSNVPFDRARKINFSNSSDGYVESDGKYYITKNGGMTWDRVTFPPSDIEIISYIQTLDQNNWYAKHFQGDIYNSTDGGVTWSTIDRQSIKNNISPIYLDQTHGLGFTRSDLFETFDGGVSWEPFGYSHEDVSDFSFNGNVFLSGRSGMLMKITTEQNPVVAGNIYGDTSIVGDETCEYAAYNISNTRYTWSVQGGKIIRYNDNKILVRWDDTYENTPALTLNSYDKCNVSQSVVLKISFTERRSFTKPVIPEEPMDPEVPLNVVNNDKDEGYLIIPNPAREYADVVWQSHKNPKDIKIEIYNMQGRLLIGANQYIDDNSIRLNLSTISEGFYVIKINDGHTIVSKKILVYR